MKEYKTLKVDPEDEVAAIQCYEIFGWNLDESREVYNESQEIVGANQKSNVTQRDGFFAGFLGDAKVNTKINIQTRTNVTHFLSMRFSRETSMKNYDRISALQKEYDAINYVPYSDLPKKPIGMTVLGLLGFISLILPLAAIVCWISYASKKKKALAQNKYADEKNPKIKERINEIITEASKLTEESKAV